MAEVIDLDAQRPHWAGNASCIDCNHEWVAVTPLQTVSLECPRCSGKGVRFSLREMKLIRGLEKIATGSAPHEGPAVTLMVAREIAAQTLANAGWPPE